MKSEILHLHSHRTSTAADLSVRKESVGFPQRSFLQQIPSLVKKEPELFSEEDAALKENHQLHVYSSEALLIVITMNSDVTNSNVLTHLFIIPSVRQMSSIISAARMLNRSHLLDQLNMSCVVVVYFYSTNNGKCPQTGLMD